MAKRNCRIEKLNKQPLALVLIQIKFTPISYIEKYIPIIQEKLQLLDFSGMKETPCVEIKVTSDIPVSSQTKQWIFTSTDNYENIIINSNQVTFQSTKYDLFEDFYKKFQSISNSLVSSIPNFDKSVLIKRLGIRYVDQIIPINEHDEIDSYINSDYNIKQVPLFSQNRKICVTTQAGTVEITKDNYGVLLYRITQGEEGLTLPPDLMSNPPKLKTELKTNQVIGLIDIDHSFIPTESIFYNKDNIEELFYRMHDNTHNLFASIISDEGKKKWS